MNDNRITKKIFLWDRRICCSNAATSEMFAILSECGLEHCFFELSTLDLAYMSDCMHERTSKTWWYTIVLKPKLRTYVKFKQSFKTADHVLGYMSRYSCQELILRLITIPSGDSPTAY